MLIAWRLPDYVPICFIDFSAPQIHEPAQFMNVAKDAARREPGKPNPPLRFAATIFISAFLLFQIQLLIGKQILPWYGGAAAVWNTCVVVFQALLLCGYSYSHWLVSRFEPKKQARIHGSLVVVSMVILVLQFLVSHRPILPAEALKPVGSTHPILSILLVLGSSVAVPFFVLSTTGPLVQSWFARILPDSSPYQLYATSNAGSLLGLASYPFFLEWMFHLTTQAWIWSAGYLAFAAGILLLSRRVYHFAPRADMQPLRAPDAQPVAWRRFALWVGLSACPSAMMLAATTQISSDVPPMPFLWMLPLVLYLLTLMICFDNDRLFRRRVFYPLHFVAVIGLVLFNAFVKSGGFQAVIGLYCLVVFTTGMIAHGELSRSRPPSNQLTFFYLAMATGGVLGGAFVGLVAPAVFQDVHEFRITLVVTFCLTAIALSRYSRPWLPRSVSALAAGFALAALLVSIVTIQVTPAWSRTTRIVEVALLSGVFFILLVTFLRKTRNTLGRDGRAVFLCAAYSWFVAAVGVGFMAHFPMKMGHVVLTERNFFGVKRVVQDDKMVLMTHGSTLHGVQSRDPLRRREPTYYYSFDSGIGLLLRNFPRTGDPGLRVGVVGLGVGTLAAYGKAGDVFRFYEIDPQVIRLAQGQNSYFHFLGDSHAGVEFVEGDARMSLEAEARNHLLQRFDVLVLDAFSGDTVPMHLLTREAMQVYREHLRGASSVVAIHISNRYIDLKPVLTALAESYHLEIAYMPARDSHWVLLSPSRAVLSLPVIKSATFNSFLDQKPVLWTDDYSNLLPLM